MIKPREGSLFAILSRLPFWVSLLIAGALFAVMRNWLPDVLAAATTLPFIGVAVYAGYVQFKTPSATRVSEGLDALRALAWPHFSSVIAESFRKEGFIVTPSKRAGVDFDMEQSGYVTLLACKRWKVAQAGIGPLRELVDAAKAADARGCCFITAGALTGTAQTFATDNKIRIINGMELVQRAGAAARTAKRPAA